MCYLVAKDRDAHGCFALKTTHGKHLSGGTAGNDQQTNGLWGLCTISLRGYGAGIPDACKRASAVIYVDWGSHSVALFFYFQYACRI